LTQVTKDGDGSEPPATVGETLANTVATCGDNVALRVQRDGRWLEWTWSEYYAESMKFGKASIAAGSPALRLNLQSHPHEYTGLKPHDVVNIIGFNSPEWLIADVGSILAGFPLARPSHISPRTPTEVASPLASTLPMVPKPATTWQSIARLSLPWSRPL
jgi:acyl-CoA synthetase (AMP-forming)/AMP-acid ligase II